MIFGLVQRSQSNVTGVGYAVQTSKQHIKTWLLYVHQKMCSGRRTAAPFMTTRNPKSPWCPSAVEWVQISGLPTHVTLHSNENAWPRTICNNLKESRNYELKNPGMRALTVYFCLNKGNLPSKTGRSSMWSEVRQWLPLGARFAENRREFEGAIEGCRLCYVPYLGTDCTGACSVYEAQWAIHLWGVHFYEWILCVHKESVK